MNGNEALNLFERLLIPARTVAGERTAWNDYRTEQLPLLPDEKLALLDQGFAAGYDAAMARVRAILAAAQTAALRGDQP